jgi:hypothetical protein
MKQLFVCVLFTLFTLASFAQQQNPYPRTITVAGSAELEIIPDEIYVQVHLREYEKRGQGKVDIETIRKDFLNKARSIGIPDTAISIATYGGNDNAWWRRKKKNELYAAIFYQVKLKSSTQLDQLVDRLDDEATQNFFIERTSHSKLPELRKQLKIQAVKAAREKAGYLTEAAGESLGVAVTIHEPTEYYVPYYNMRTANVAMKMRQEGVRTEPEESPVDFKKMKLRYDVSVVFALK